MRRKGDWGGTYGSFLCQKKTGLIILMIIIITRRRQQRRRRERQ